MSNAKTNADLPFQQEFNKIISEKLPMALPGMLDGQFVAAAYPPGFNYSVTYGNNGYYNALTLSTLDSTLHTGSDGITSISNQKLSNLYGQVLKSSGFAFSESTEKQLDAWDKAAEGQVASVLQEFTNYNFKFTEPNPPGGKLADVFNQLTALYGPVTENCDNIPKYLSGLRDALATYIEMAGQAYALHSRAAQATAILNAAMRNAANPSAANGGLQTGDTSFYPGFEKLPPANQLIGSLSTDKNAFSIHLDGDSFSESSCKIHVETGSEFVIPIGGLLDIEIRHESQIDISSYTFQETSFSMDISYPGLSIVGVVPSSLSNDKATGWYDANILHELKKNTGSDVDGYRLLGSEFNVADLFGRNGRLNYFKTLVISRQPTIDVTFTKINISEFRKHIHTDNSVKVHLFGFIPLGSADHSYTLDTVDYNESVQSVTLHFQAPDVSGTIPLEQQVAYVLGGVPNET